MVIEILSRVSRELHQKNGGADAIESERLKMPGKSERDGGEGEGGGVEVTQLA